MKLGGMDVVRRVGNGEGMGGVFRRHDTGRIGNLGKLEQWRARESYWRMGRTGCNVRREENWSYTAMHCIMLQLTALCDKILYFSALRCTFIL